MNEFGSLIEPPSVPFRFGAPGWYILAAILLITLTVSIVLLLKHYQRNRYRRQALRWLQIREEELLHHKSLAVLVYETNMLLKRIAMGRYGRAAAALRGMRWLELLNKTMRRDLFNKEDEALLNQLIYQPKAALQPDIAANFTNKSKTWIQHHRYHNAF